MLKALVFGSSGLLGRALSKTLELRGWNTIPLTRADGDLLDGSFLEKIVDLHKPDYVFNCAAFTNVDGAEDNIEEAFAINEKFPENLAKILAGREKGMLFHFGTDFVFSGAVARDHLETDRTEPLNVYGASKLAGENKILEFLPERSCVIRTAWLFGFGRKNFVDTILSLAASRPTLQVVNDQTGSPTFADDLANFSERLAQGGQTGLFHGVNSGRASWFELAKKAVELAGISCEIKPISSAEWPQKANRPAFSVLDNSRLANALGYEPRNWQDALAEYVAGRQKSLRQ